jgi:hypothetical protein
MADGSGEDPTLRVLGEKPPTYPTGAPETAQHWPTQEQIEGSFLSVFGLYDTECSAFHVEMFPLELNQCVSAQSTMALGLAPV